MNETRAILAETVDRLFNDLAPAEVLRASEKGDWPAALWQAIEDNGLTGTLVPESAGGAGGSFADAFVVLRAAGRAALPVPLADTMIGAWLLAGAGLEVPPGPLSVAPVRIGETLLLSAAGSNWRLDGTAERVPWGGRVGRGRPPSPGLWHRAHNLGSLE